MPHSSSQVLRSAATASPAARRRTHAAQTAGLLVSGLLSALLSLLPATMATAAGDADFDDAAIAQIDYPDWFKDSFLDLPDDAAMAAEAGKQGLFIFFSTQGCSYCHLFIQTSLQDPAIAARLQAHFDTLGLEIFSDAELVDFSGETTRVKTFALAEGVQFAPTLLFYDTEGQALLKLTGYYEPARFAAALEYLIDGHHAEMTLRDYLAQQDAAEPGTDTGTWTLPADALFEPPPHMLARDRMPAERPLLVLFEGKDCPRCPRFHAEVLGDADLRAQLDGFDVVRLDAGDTESPVLTPAGKRTSPADWYATLGFSALPALVFFGEDGRQVLATDALVLASRMQNSIGFVTERAYERGWTYQRYARTQAIERGQAEVP
jgi:thioredoxin-related protein